MSEIKPDVNKKVNQLREMDARDRWRLIGNWLLDHAMIIIILLMVIYIQIQRPAFLATASIVNIIQLTATRLPIALGIAGAIILTGTDLSDIMRQVIQNGVILYALTQVKKGGDR